MYQWVHESGQCERPKQGGGGKSENLEPAEAAEDRPNDQLHLQWLNKQVDSCSRVEWWW